VDEFFSTIDLCFMVNRISYLLILRYAISTLIAREKFRKEVQRHPNMELRSLGMKLNQTGHHGINDDLTIDVGVLRRSKTKVLIHICGTHGVEGFVGSAIQSFLLDNSTIIKKDDHYDDTLPTLVFVHALNPFGSKLFN
jgi:hypothetical protein